MIRVRARVRIMGFGVRVNGVLRLGLWVRVRGLWS